MRRPAGKSGKANVLSEVTGVSSSGAAGVEVQTRSEGSAEIKSGRAWLQQAAHSNLQRLLFESKSEG
jgi:hypothetical protein